MIVKICPRPGCHRPMFPSRHKEVERIGDCTFVSMVYQSECPVCSTTVTTHVPIIPTQLAGPQRGAV